MNYLTKSPENKDQLTHNDDAKQYYLKGVYVRDDHCDWGSSGMKDLVETLNDSN